MSMNPSKFNRDRVNSMLEVGVRDVLCHIFSCGTPNKSSATPLDQYLENLPPDSTANYPEVAVGERRFNSEQIEQIHRDPTCTTFDITLLFKAIKLACEGVARYNDSAWYTPSNMMEYYVHAIKKERNNSSHGSREITAKELLDTATRLRQMLHNALGAAKTRYGRSDAELNSKIQEVDNKLDEIMCEVLGEKDLLTYKDIQLKEDLIKETNAVLKTHFSESLNIDPLSFLTDTKLDFHIQKVFTEIEITRGRVRGKGKKMKYQDMVKAARTGPAPGQPQVLLVEGEAGSGKTTFVKMVTDEWFKDVKDRIITGLEYYDLLLHVQCRERTITSVNCFLKNEVSQVFLKYRDLILPLIKKCKILMLIDGLDESNEDSVKLIDDILTQMKNVNGCTLLFTSRPEGITSFITRIPSEYQVSYIDLIGIPESHRELFVRRYHEEIKRQIGDTLQDTEKLVEKVRQVLEKEHFRLPLNMVFLTWVYIHDPSAITSTTTQTQLYYSTYQLCLQKLLNRLARHSSTRSMDREIIKSRLEQPLGQVQYESLLALWRSQLTFQPKAIKSIRDSCTNQGIPQGELLSALFTQKVHMTHLGIHEQYLAPHKGLQDFYAALHIANHHNLTTSSASVRGVLEEALGKLDNILDPLQNVLSHVAGLIHTLPSTVLNTVSEEVVDMLYESGIKMRNQWLDIVEDTRGNPVVMSRVARYFAADPTIYLGSNDSEDEEEENEEDCITHSTLCPLRIDDKRVESFKLLLPFLPPCKVDITLNKQQGSHMGDLLNAMDRHTCISLTLMHHYQDPDPTTTSDQILKQLSSRNRLKEFRGHLTEEGIRHLPHSIRKISLVLTDDEHAARTLTALHSVCPLLPSLHRINIHVPVAKVTPSSLMPVLPSCIENFGWLNLLLSGVNDELIEKACLIAKGLQCHIRFNSVVFPRVSVSKIGYRKLLKDLAETGIGLGFLMMGYCKDEDGADLPVPKVNVPLLASTLPDDCQLWLS